MCVYVYIYICIYVCACGSTLFGQLEHPGDFIAEDRKRSEFRFGAACCAGCKGFDVAALQCRAFGVEVVGVG